MQLLEFVWRCSAGPARAFHAAARPMVRQAHPGAAVARRTGTHAARHGLSAAGAACRFVPLALAVAATVSAPFLAARVLPAGPAAESVGPAATSPASAGSGPVAWAASADAAPAWSLLSGGDAYLLATMGPSSLPFPEQPLASPLGEAHEPPEFASSRVPSAIPEAGSLAVLVTAVCALALAGRMAAARVTAARRQGLPATRTGRAAGPT